MLETEVVTQMAQALQLVPDVDVVSVEERLSDSARPDLIIHRAQRIDIVEVKARSPLVRPGLDATIGQLHHYEALAKKRWPDRVIGLTLALPNDVLATDRVELLSNRRISIWDRDVIQELLEQGSGGVLPPMFPSSSLSHSAERPDAASGRRLSEALRSIQCGRLDWSRYQTLCGDILTFLFCPPLHPPLLESPNASRVNRRDIVLPNYANDGVWKFLLDQYRANYVVVDAKNLCRSVTKGHVLQLANYLSESGTGLFGMILTRRDADRGAEVTRREQWILHRKMIVVVSDADLAQMLESKAAQLPPEEILLQMIQDFRLGI